MIFVVTLLLFASSADVAVGDSKVVTETAEAKPVKPKKICRAGAETGSRMTSKICKTQAEWDAQPGVDANQLKRSSRGN